MSMKMSELVKLTDTSKSTILFYVKEGLLPQPKKPKPNLHLYDDKCVEMIQFIKYLQTHFNASISEIKTITKGGKLNLERGFESLLDTLELMMGSAHNSTYTAAYVMTHYDLTEAQLAHYLESGLLFERDGVFSDKELEILEILLRLEQLHVDEKLLKGYVMHARAIATLEVEVATQMLRHTEDKNKALKALFDTTLILKPYLCHMQTLQTYRQAEELV